MEYSAVSQPPFTPCTFIQRGTSSWIMAEQMTRVLPKQINTEPVECGATSSTYSILRSWSWARPSVRGMEGELGFEDQAMPTARAQPALRENRANKQRRFRAFAQDIRIVWKIKIESLPSVGHSSYLW